MGHDYRKPPKLAIVAIYNEPIHIFNLILEFSCRFWENSLSDQSKPALSDCMLNNAVGSL